MSARHNVYGPTLPTCVVGGVYNNGAECCFCRQRGQASPRYCPMGFTDMGTDTQRGNPPRYSCGHPHNCPIDTTPFICKGKPGLPDPDCNKDCLNADEKEDCVVHREHRGCHEERYVTHRPRTPYPNTVRCNKPGEHGYEGGMFTKCHAVGYSAAKLEYQG